jgi:hypothetical protein
MIKHSKLRTFSAYMRFDNLANFPLNGAKILSHNDVPDSTCVLHVINTRHGVQQVGVEVVEIQRIPVPRSPKTSTIDKIPNDFQVILIDSDTKLESTDRTNWLTSQKLL